MRGAVANASGVKFPCRIAASRLARQRGNRRLRKKIGFDCVAVTGNGRANPIDRGAHSALTWRSLDGPRRSLASPRWTLRARRLLRRGIRLHHAENIALAVVCVGEPADSRDRHSWHDHHGSQLADFLERCVETVYADRADVRIDRLHRYRRRSASGEQAAVNAYRARLAGLDQPVILWAFPLVERPAEQGGVESDRSLGIGSLNL